MLRASGVSARIEAEAVPILHGARSLVEAGHVPSGTIRNQEDVSEDVRFADSVDETTRTLLADAQTSGGLLMCVAPGALHALLAGLDGRAPVAAVIGEVHAGRSGSIEIA